MRWSALGLLAGLVLALAGPAPSGRAADAPALAGNWDGAINAGQGLRLLFEIKAEPGGGYSVVARSPDQGQAPMGSSIRVEGSRMILDMPMVDARAEGTVSADARTMTGGFTQYGRTVPLTLTHRAEGAPLPPAPPRALAAPPSDAEILAALKTRIDVQKRGVGVVVGIVDRAGKRRIIAYGAADRPGGKPVNGESLFEIGSITKTFTSLLLTDAVRRGEVKLDDPVAKYLPAQIKVPTRGDKQITLADLATHTSGLPRMPSNFAPANPVNPYADYQTDKLFAFLDGYALTRDIGARWEYSNYGVALLGQALARAAGTDYTTLLTNRILQPLGMTSTAIVLTPPLQARFTTGHNASLAPVSQWDLAAFAPAGGIRSSVDDMLKLMAAEIGATPTPLAPAMADQLLVRRPTGPPRSAQALGWQVTTYDNAKLAEHGGATGGFQSYAAYERARGLAVVVLSNAGVDVSDLATYALGGQPPAVYAQSPPPARSRRPIPLDVAQVPAYVGSYRVNPTTGYIVTEEAGGLTFQATNLPKRTLTPVGKDEFVTSDVDVTIAFRRNLEGKVVAMTLFQNGGRSFARRDGA